MGESPAQKQDEITYSKWILKSQFVIAWKNHLSDRMGQTPIQKSGMK
jgi:hypothetical protein